jgi:cytoskeleton protein RodZ
MSDGWAAEATPVIGPEAAPDGLTAGMLLRRAREAAGLHVAALAVSLKVPVRKLEALEENRFDELPDAVFVRALASSVCRSLKIDSQPILERLPQTIAPRLVRDGEGINAPFRAPSDGAPPGWTEQLTKPVFLAVFALLLGALVLILLPNAQKPAQAPTIATATGPADPPPPPMVLPGPDAPGSGGNSSSPPGALQDAAAAVQPLAAKPVVMTNTAPAVGTPVAAPASVPAGPASAAAKPASAQSLVAAVTPPHAQAPAGSASNTVQALSTNGIVVLRAKGPSWVEVVDAKGVVGVRKTLSAGESAGATGALPLQVTIGRVDVTEVQVRGKPFDLRPVSKDNVARFEVK